MRTIEDRIPEKARFSGGTWILANLCHKCGICPYADRQPHSPLGRLMRWHRSWCPARAAHTKVYGRKPLS
jgi:hypothetical protein